MFCHELIHHNGDHITLGTGYYHEIEKLKGKIRSEEGYLYTGMIEDLNRRLEEHNNKPKSF